MYANADLVVFSHLRWNFVWQRPQHLLTRFAGKRKVLFIEEPIPGASSEPRWEKQNPTPNVTVCRLLSPSHSHGYSDEQLAILKNQVPALLKEEGVKDCITWFYTPMALPLLDSTPHRAVAYDCMDELSAFHGAPPQMLPRESELLRLADVVFTGGPSLYRAKKDRHANVHCFPSSVASDHFRKAREGITEATDQVNLPHPRLGFFGVIDERFDVPLLASLAEARPDWHFCLVGPVVKIDPKTLPQAPNIHYFGQRSYEELPSFLAGWDVCLLPFARNDSTKFISPTKTLEYMAAERPIVSTPITDVVDAYGEIVYIGATAEEFLAKCDEALSSSAEERERRYSQMREVLANTSWDATAEAMSAFLDKAADNRRSQQSRAQPSSVTPPTEHTPPVVIIGAGPTGLSAAYHLGKDALLLERNPTVGGWCRSIEKDGFTFDFAGHIMFSNDPYVHEMYKTLLGDNVHWQDREAWIYSKDVYTRYPFQGSLYGHSPAVIKECILGAIEARYGGLKPEVKSSASTNGQGACATKNSTNGHTLTNGNGHANGHSNGNGHSANGNGHSNGNGNGHTNGHANGHTNGLLGDRLKLKEALSDCCADGVLESTAKLVNGSQTTADGKPAQPRNFEEFIYKVWGAGIAKHFAIPYNRKLWAVPLTEMETSWLGGRVPMPDLGEMIEGALSPSAKPMGPNARFGYPLRGGFQALMDGFLPLLKGPVRLNTSVAKIAPFDHYLTLSDGTRIPYERLISTMPLPVLIRQMGDAVPDEIAKAAAGLRYISVRCVHIGVARENLTDKHWIYYPEESIFHRIFVQGNASPHCNPAGGFGLTCEITYHPQYKPLPVDGNDLIKRCIKDCQDVGFFNADDKILTTTQVDLPHAYVVYDHDRAPRVKAIREWLAQHDIILSGRYSEWEYYNSDHAFLAGKKAAEQAKQEGSVRKPELALA